jgi:hypothetical protein
MTINKWPQFFFSYGNGLQKPNWSQFIFRGILLLNLYGYTDWILKPRLRN